MNIEGRKKNPVENHEKSKYQITKSKQAPITQIQNTKESIGCHNYYCGQYRMIWISKTIRCNRLQYFGH